MGSSYLKGIGVFNKILKKKDENIIINKKLEKPKSRLSKKLTS